LEEFNSLHWQGFFAQQVANGVHIKHKKKFVCILPPFLKHVQQMTYYEGMKELHTNSWP
jgi:hypothetical protein